jgi:hypothetical protein
VDNEDFNGWSRNQMMSEIRILHHDLVESNKELEKYKIAIKYFEEHGYSDVVRNLLSY